MKKNLPLLCILLIQAFFSGAQGLPCGGGRFTNRVFTTTTVTPGILFGRNTTYMGISKDLLMDIYQPAGDAATIRPLFIFAFGGAFISGDRTQLGRVCDSLAAKGYVTAAIDYRLYDNPAGVLGLILNANDGLDAVAKGMSDIKAAVRYFKRDAATTKTYKIDTNNIYLGGISSGSIMALHTAYVNTIAETVPPVSTYINLNGGMEGNTDLPGSPLIGTYSFQGIKGVWNMSGALYDSSYIKAGDPILFSIHGTNDGVVPFGYGRLFSDYTTLGAFACGSSSLNNQAVKVGVPSTFIAVQGGGHQDIYADTAIIQQINTTASTFFGNALCPIVLPVSGISLKGNIVKKHIQLNWQTLTESGSKGFVLEKQSAAGWASVSEVRSKATNGNSSLPLNYTFDDLLPDYGANIYRVKTISINGDITYSNTIKVLWNDKSADIFVIYPNPAGATLNYKTTVTGINTTMKIYGADMRLMRSVSLNNSRSVSVSGLNSGLYLAVIFDGQNRRAASTWFIKK